MQTLPIAFCCLNSVVTLMFDVQQVLLKRNGSCLDVEQENQNTCSHKVKVYVCVQVHINYVRAPMQVLVFVCVL